MEAAGDADAETYRKGEDFESQRVSTCPYIIGPLFQCRLRNMCINIRHESFYFCSVQAVFAAAITIANRLRFKFFIVDSIVNSKNFLFTGIRESKQHRVVHSPSRGLHSVIHFAKWPRMCDEREPSSFRVRADDLHTNSIKSSGAVRIFDFSLIVDGVWAESRPVLF